MEAAFLEKIKKESGEIQIRAFSLAISGPAVGFRVDLSD